MSVDSLAGLNTWIVLFVDSDQAGVAPAPPRTRGAPVAFKSLPHPLERQRSLLKIAVPSLRLPNSGAIARFPKRSRFKFGAIRVAGGPSKNKQKSVRRSQRLAQQSGDSRARGGVAGDWGRNRAAGGVGRTGLQASARRGLHLRGSI